MKNVETLIIGAGPAGLQMGYFLGRAGREYLILEAGEQAGTFFRTQPRRRTLISINKRFNGFPEADYNMRHDWNSLLTDDFSHLFRDYSKALFPHADELCAYLVDFAEKYDIRVQYNTRVTRISRADDGGFTLIDNAGARYHCQRLLMATGATSPWTPPEIEGLEHAANYRDYDVDPALYEDKRVLIIGRGNSAFEVADELSPHAAVVHVALDNRPVKHAWQTHFVGDLRAINNNILDMYQLKSLHAALGISVTKIEPADDGTLTVHWHQDMPHWEVPGTVRSSYTYDHVICCTGWRYVEPDMFDDDVRPARCPKNKYPLLDASWETSVPGMFYLGTVMGVRDRKAASSFIHGFRYLIRTLFHVLEHRYQGVALPSTTRPLRTEADLEALTDALISRLSTTSALWQLFGVLCDVMVLSDGELTIYPELSVEHVLNDPRFAEADDLVLMTLDLGFDKYPAGADAMDFIHFPNGPSCSAFVHGVLRHYRRGELVDERHLSETLTGRYDRTFSSDYGPAPWRALLHDFLNRVAGELVPSAPIPAYDIEFEANSASSQQNPHGLVACLHGEPAPLYPGSTRAETEPAV